MLCPHLFRMNLKVLQIPRKVNVTFKAVYMVLFCKIVPLLYKNIARRPFLIFDQKFWANLTSTL